MQVGGVARIHAWESRCHGVLGQVEVENAEAYMYDGECLAKAEEMGKPGLVTIKQRQVSGPAAAGETVVDALQTMFCTLTDNSGSGSSGYHKGNLAAHCRPG